MILQENNTPAFHYWRENVAAYQEIGLNSKRFVTHFVYKIDEIYAIFSNLELGAQPKFAHAYCVFPLWSWLASTRLFKDAIHWNIAIQWMSES